MHNILDYLDDKHIVYRIEGSEAILRCPNCGKEKLYINIDSSLFHCFVCEAEDPDSMWAKGHINSIKENFGDIISVGDLTTRFIGDSKEEKSFKDNLSDAVKEYKNALKLNKSAMKYLYSRGFTNDIIERFSLGYVRLHGQNWVSIPSFEDNIPKLIKYRKLLPDENDKLPKYIRENNCKSILFNGDCIDKFEEIIVTEGELDCITLIQNGYENVVGMTGGAGTFKPEWHEKLVQKKKIYLVLDPDPVGQKAARVVWAERLGINKCYNVVLPEHMDVNDFFQTYTQEDFNSLLSKSTIFKVDGIVSINHSFRNMYNKSLNEETVEKFPLPWESVNRLIGGGLERKRLTVLGGAPGMGKTTFALQTAYHLALVYGLPTLFFCMEMPDVSLTTKIVQIHKELTLEEVMLSDALIYSMEIGEIPLYFGYSSSVKPDIFYNTMVSVRDRYGVEFGVFDNLQRMVRSDKESEMAKASGVFKDITMDLNIPFMLLSQPRKLNSEENPTYDDLKGSGAIPADADDVLLIHRRRTTGIDNSSSFEAITQIIVDKSRYSSGGKCRLEFKGEISKFFEVT